MHRIETHPADEHIQKHLDAFANTFPPGIPFPQRLRAVLSYEGRISDGRIQDRKAVFQEQLDALRPSWTRGDRIRWMPSVHPDLFQRKHPETAWQAVVELFSDRDECLTVLASSRTCSLPL